MTHNDFLTQRSLGRKISAEVKHMLSICWASLRLGIVSEASRTTRLGKHDSVTREIRDGYDSIIGLHDSPSISRRYPAMLRKVAACLLLLFVVGVGSAWGDAAVIFSENFGSTSSNTAYGSYSSFSATTSMFTSGHQTTVAENYSGTGKVGKNNLAAANLSSGYTGASGLSGCYEQGTSNTESTIIQISNIDISGYSNLHLSFGALGAASTHKVKVTYKIGSGSESTLISSGSITNANWTLVEADITGTGSSLTLYIKHKPTNNWTIRLDDIKLTGCPVPSVLTNGTITSSTAHLSWTDNDDTNSYEVYCNTSGSAPGTSQTPTTTVTNKYVDLESLTAGTPYYWWVRSKCSNSNKSAWVAGTSFTTTSSTYTVDYAAGGGGGTVPTSHTGLSGSTNIDLKSPDNLTAPSGKCFRGWTNDGGTNIYAAGARVTVTEATTFTAVWVDKPVVYLKNTMNWDAAYVYFYKGAYWDNSNGSGSDTDNANYVAGPIAMTWNESTGLFSYTCPEYYTYTYVAFTKGNQADYDNFYDTEVIYCNNDFQYDKVVVPSTQTGRSSLNDDHALYYTTYEYQTVAAASGTGYYFASSANTAAWETKGYEFMAGTGDTVVYSHTFTANQSFEFKVYHHGEARGNNGAIIFPVTDWDCTTGTSNWRICIGPAGQYTFKFNKSTNKMKIIYPPVSHPAAGYAYFKKPDGWGDMKAYIYTNDDNRVSDWGSSPVMSESVSICNNTYYYGAIACGYNNVIFYNVSNDGQKTSAMSATVLNCDGKWGDNTSTTWHTFETYTFTYVAGTGGSGTMTPTAGICPGSSQAVAANTFDAPNHNHFNGWTASTSVTVGGQSTTAVPAGATIQNVQGNVTLTANWAPDTYTISSTLDNCSYSEGAISTPYTYSGSAANISRTIVPSSGYALPTSISVTMGGNALTAGTDYTYNSSTGAFQITATITGAIVITVTAVQADIYKSELHTGISAWSAYSSGVAMTGSYSAPNPGDIAAGDREDAGCIGLHYHFVGWITDANKGSIVPANIVAPGASKTADGTTYWAVWEKEAAGGGDASYKLVEDDEDATEGTYLIVYNATYALNTHSDGINVNTFATYTDISSYYTNSTKSIASNATTNALAYIVETTTNGYSIKHSEEINSVATDVYLGCNTANNKGLRWDYPFTASQDEWILKADSIRSVNQSDRYIRWNNASNQERFATYLSTSVQDIQLYKYDPGVTYTDSIVACAPVTCGIPTDMSSGTPTAFGTTLSWTAPSVHEGGVSGYEYYYWADGTTEPTSGFSSTASTSVTLTNALTSSTTYHWKVRTLCNSGNDESSWCTEQTFTTAAVSLTFDVPSGVTQPSGQESSTVLPTPAGTPSNASVCWKFMGWTTGSYDRASALPATFFPAGSYAQLAYNEGTTLYAVYGEERYDWFKSASNIAAGNKYLITFIGRSEPDKEFAVSGIVQDTYSSLGVDIVSNLRRTNYIYNPEANVIWELQAGSAANTYKLYNAANNKYINLSNDESPILSETGSDLQIVKDVYDDSFIIRDATTNTNCVVLDINNYYAIDKKDDDVGYGYLYMYRLESTTYTTHPDCSTYTVTWMKGTTQITTATVNRCDGVTSTPAVANDALSCADEKTRFVGWSDLDIGSGTGHERPTGHLFKSPAQFPEITKDTTFYAVFAEISAIQTGTKFAKFEGELEEGNYVITYSTDAMKATISSSRFGYAGVTVEDDTITGPAADLIWRIEKYGNYWTIYNEDAESFACGTTTKNTGQLLTDTTGNINYALWSCSSDADSETYDFINKGRDEGSSETGNKYLRCNINGASHYGFACYASGTGGELTLYKHDLEYENYFTQCCAKTVSFTGNVTGNGTLSFSKATAETCEKDSVIMTIRPDEHYQLSNFTTTGTTAAPSSMVPAGGVTSPSEDVQSVKLRYNEDVTGAYVANATFSAIQVSNLTLQAVKIESANDTVDDHTGSSLTWSLYPSEGRTSGTPLDPQGRKLYVKFGAALPANALDKTYTWSVTVNGVATSFGTGASANVLNTNDVIEFNKNSGKLVAKAAGTAVITITANDGGGASASITITVANMPLTSVSLDPASMTIYTGQILPVTVNYDPISVTTKGYSYTGNTNVTILNKANDSFNVRGESVTEDTNNTLVITTTSDSRQASLPITIKPLPKVHFVDIVHGIAFSDVAATIDAGDASVVLFNKTTPTYADISPAPSTANTCENTHLHLIGWIDSEWSGVADYLNNTTSTKPATEDIKGATGYFFAPNALMNVDTYKNKTYYAVWAIVEE